MRLKIAGPSDDEKLKSFFKEFLLSGSLELKMERPQSFFAAYETQSDQWISLILEDQQTQQILACVTFVIQSVWLDGHKSTIAWARDLRVAQDRRAILGWTEHLWDALQEVKKKYHVDHFFSSLNLSEKKALNTFVRPRQSRRQLPRYHQFRKFDLISLHGAWPWTRNPVPHIKIKHLSPQRHEELIYYILKKSRSYDFVPWSDADSFLKSLSLWPDLNLNNFLIAVDKRENIVGCMAPWNPSNIQNWIPYNYDQRAHNFRQFLKFGHIWGWSRPLTKPVHRLKIESSLNFHFLNYIFFDHPDIFEAMIEVAYDQAGPHGFLVYSQMHDQIQMRPPLGWISARTPYGLYSLIPPEEIAPTFLDPTHLKPIYLEAFFA